MKSKIVFQPFEKTYTGRFGESVLQCAGKSRIPISQRCGGKGSCTTCKIKVLTVKAGTLSDPSPAELRLLSSEALEEGVRLACQTRVYGQVEVEVLEQAWKTTVKKIMEQRRITDEEK